MSCGPEKIPSTSPHHLRFINIDLSVPIKLQSSTNFNLNSNLSQTPPSKQTPAKKKLPELKSTQCLLTSTSNRNMYIKAQKLEY